MPVAVLRPEDRRALGAESQVVLLSQASLQAHLATHLEVGIEDYRLIPEMLDKGEVSTNRASCG